MKCIILIGYMCVGKTTIGRALGKELGRPFYDLDWYVEERFRRRVPQIFAEEGEEGFRRKERNMLHEVAEFENIVLACGGGTPCYYDNMAYMNTVAETFYLKATPETLLRHLAVSHGRRPLLEGKEPEELRTYVTEQLQAREAFYSQAHHIIDVNLLDSPSRVQDVIDTIRAAAIPPHPRG